MNSGEIVACSKSITIHSLQSRQPLHNYSHHRGLINCLSLNHNCKVIASCGQDGKVVLVNSEKTESKLAEYSFANSVKDKAPSLSACAFSPSSRYLAAGSIDSVIKLWDLKNSKQMTTYEIKNHIGSITSLAWIKNLRGQGTGTDIIASASTSGDIFLNSNKSIDFPKIKQMRMNEGVTCIKASEGSDFCRLGACTNSGTVTLWDLLGGKDKPFWEILPPLEGKQSLTSVAFSPYNPILLVTSSLDQNFTFYDIRQRKAVKKIQTEEALNCVSLHHNGHILIAGGSYGGLYIYDLKQPTKPQLKLIGHETPIKYIQLVRRQKQLPQTRTQKQHSTNSLDSMNSQPQTRGISQAKAPIIQQIRNKQTVLRPQPAINNFINIQKPSLIEQKIKEQIMDPKQLRPAHDPYKNPITKKVQIPPSFKQSGQSQLFRHRSKEGTQTIQSQSLKREIKQIKQSLTAIRKGQQDLKRQMFDMQQRINYSMIKQFQLNQQQIFKFMQDLLTKDSQKQKALKKLQQQNKRLRQSRF